MTRRARWRNRNNFGEWLLLTGSVALTVSLALGLIQWLAPSLLGARGDWQIVEVDDKVVPFFEGVFREADYTAEGPIFTDPHTWVRAKPLLPASPNTGPHDILGFRNPAVPNVVDVLAIGDSQTYGNNAAMEETWPSHLARSWPRQRPVVYNMSTGGWTAVQYLEMARHALVFQPRVMVIAFYSGNDALEAFVYTYSDERYAALRPDPALSMKDIPPVMANPLPPEQLWTVLLKNGSRMTFSPRHRLVSNLADNPVVGAGYAIMIDAARRIATLARTKNVPVVFTIIPTKELVYAERLRRDSITLNDDYSALISAEQANIRKLADAVRRIPSVEYVDVVGPLQAAAIIDKAPIYPDDENGHPLAAGYKVIADAVATAVRKFVPPPVRGLLLMESGPDRYRILLASEDGIRDFASESVTFANGWKPGSGRLVYQRDIATLPYRGIISATDPVRFGPGAFR